MFECWLCILTGIAYCIVYSIHSICNLCISSSTFWLLWRIVIDGSSDDRNNVSLVTRSFFISVKFKNLCMRLSQVKRLTESLISIISHQYTNYELPWKWIYLTLLTTKQTMFFFYTFHVLWVIGWVIKIQLIVINENRVTLISTLKVWKC